VEQVIEELIVGEYLSVHSDDSQGYKPGASGMTRVYRPTPQFVFIHVGGRYSQTHVSNGTVNEKDATAFTHGNVLPWNLQTVLSLLIRLTDR
jgi:hypothetical protein